MNDAIIEVIDTLDLAVRGIDTKNNVIGKASKDIILSSLIDLKHKVKTYDKDSSELYNTRYSLYTIRNKMATLLNENTIALGHLYLYTLLGSASSLQGLLSGDYSEAFEKIDRMHTYDDMEKVRELAHTNTTLFNDLVGRGCIDTSDDIMNDLNADLNSSYSIYDAMTLGLVVTHELIQRYNNDSITELINRQLERYRIVDSYSYGIISKIHTLTELILCIDKDIVRVVRLQSDSWPFRGKLEECIVNGIDRYGYNITPLTISKLNLMGLKSYKGLKVYSLILLDTLKEYIKQNSPDI